jgi:hypothetical protein
MCAPGGTWSRSNEMSAKSPLRHELMKASAMLLTHEIPRHTRRYIYPICRHSHRYTGFHWSTTASQRSPSKEFHAASFELSYSCPSRLRTCWTLGSNSSDCEECHSLGLWCRVVCYMFTDVSEECYLWHKGRSNESTTRALLAGWLLGFLFDFENRGNVPPKRLWTYTGLHKFTHQKTIIYSLLVSDAEDWNRLEVQKICWPLMKCISCVGHATAVNWFKCVYKLLVRKPE